jgi:ankyrin repeat protein
MNIQNELIYVIATNDLEGVQDCVRRGANVNAPSAAGSMPLARAIRGKREAIFDYFLSLPNIDVNQSDVNGERPIHVAAVENNHNFLDKLLAKQAEIDAVDRFGMTALYYATRRNYTEVAIGLIQANANPDIIVMEDPTLELRNASARQLAEENSFTAIREAIEKKFPPKNKFVITGKAEEGTLSEGVIQATKDDIFSQPATSEPDTIEMEGLKQYTSLTESIASFIDDFVEDIADASNLEEASIKLLCLEKVVDSQLSPTEFNGFLSALNQLGYSKAITSMKHIHDLYTNDPRNQNMQQRMSNMRTQTTGSAVSPEQMLSYIRKRIDSCVATSRKQVESSYSAADLSLHQEKTRQKLNEAIYNAPPLHIASPMATLTLEADELDKNKNAQFFGYIFRSMAMGNPDVAITNLQDRIRDLKKQTDAKAKTYLVSCYDALGFAYMQTGQFRHAIAQYQIVRNAFRAAPEKPAELMARNTINIATAYQMLNQRDQAKNLLEATLRQLEAIVPFPLVAAQIASLLGAEYYVEQKFVDAVPYFLRARNIALAHPHDLDTILEYEINLLNTLSLSGNLVETWQQVEHIKTKYQTHVLKVDALKWAALLVDTVNTAMIAWHRLNQHNLEVYLDPNSQDNIAGFSQALQASLQQDTDNFIQLIKGGIRFSIELVPQCIELCNNFALHLSRHSQASVLPPLIKAVAKNQAIKMYQTLETIFAEKLPERVGDRYMIADNIAQMALGLGNPRLAVEYLTKADHFLGLLPESTDKSQKLTKVAFRLGKAYFDCKNYEEAKKYYTLAQKYNSATSNPLERQGLHGITTLVLGIIMFKDGEYERGYQQIYNGFNLVKNYFKPDHPIRQYASGRLVEYSIEADKVKPPRSTISHTYRLAVHRLLEEPQIGL